MAHIFVHQSSQIDFPSLIPFLLKDWLFNCVSVGHGLSFSQLSNQSMDTCIVNDLLFVFFLFLARLMLFLLLFNCLGRSFLLSFLLIRDHGAALSLFLMF